MTWAEIFWKDAKLMHEKRRAAHHRFSAIPEKKTVGVVKMTPRPNRAKVDMSNCTYAIVILSLSVLTSVPA